LALRSYLGKHKTCCSGFAIDLYEQIIDQNIQCERPTLGGVRRYRFIGLTYRVNAFVTTLSQDHFAILGVQLSDTACYSTTEVGVVPRDSLFGGGFVRELLLGRRCHPLRDCGAHWR